MSGMGVRRNFQRGAKSTFAYLFHEFVGDAMQMDVHKQFQCYGSS